MVIKLLFMIWTFSNRTAFLLTLALGAALAHGAGGVNGGGGSAIVCRGSHGEIERAELLDLFEAKERYGLTLSKPSGNLEEDYLRAVRNTYHIQGSDEILIEPEARESLQAFFKSFQFTMTGLHLPSLSDLGQTISPPAGCSLEQLAIFRDDISQGEIDSEIWSAMDSLNQAALITHEFFYKFERGLSEKTSEGTRASVAHVYSSGGPVPVLEGLPKIRSLCFTGASKLDSENPHQKISSFYVYSGRDETSNPVTTFQLTYLMGRALLAKTTVVLPGLSWILAKGDPERELISNRLVVWEKSANKKLRVAVVGSQRSDWEIELEYVYRKPVKIGLYQKGMLLEQAFVIFCDRQ